MNDNYYLDDMIVSLDKEIIMERYYPLIEYKRDLTEILHKTGAVLKEQITNEIIEDIRMMLGDDVAYLFARYIHIYDFNKLKLREIENYESTSEYDALYGLIRLPGVRILRAKLYLDSGVTLETLAEKSTEKIRTMVCDYIQKENCSEILPQPKEVNCHRAVARMILHTDN